ncbi:hypothetical protein QJS10_CPB11g01313 [Acorus calamus]|uniref:Zinc finger GRF-type domain-containing protein n=1 Tax=Acorus calamus TaxID=4465 RepID=A0AAV9DYB0_ACOCL|nr:hypothetical protein QJS10_CPB11g01313 [Acorus calamus]
MKGKKFYKCVNWGISMKFYGQFEFISNKSRDCDFFAWADDMLNDAYELERKLNMINELVDVKIKEMEIKMSKMKVKMNSLEEKFIEMVEKMDKRTYDIVLGGLLHATETTTSCYVVGGLLPLSPV